MPTTAPARDVRERPQSFLDNSQLFDTWEPRVDRGGLVLIQLAHNDRTTTRERYRANLTGMVERVQARDGAAVLVTPVVRRRFDGDGRHTSVHGARTFAGLVLEELRDQRLVPGGVIR